MLQRTRLLCSMFVAMLALSASVAFAQSPFYEGKTIRIIIGFSAGGGFDISARAIGRHIVKYIPGRPNIIVEPMPGAATMVAATHIYNTKSDGLTIGYVEFKILLQEVLGVPVRYDSRKFEWLGSPSAVTPICLFSKASGITSIDKWKASKEPVKLATAGLAGDIAYDTAKILSHAIGLPLRLVTGHKGNQEMKLAILRGEVAGMCLSTDAANVVWGDELESGEVQIIIQDGVGRNPELANVPHARDLVKDKEALQLMKVGIELPAQHARVLMLPPGTPKDRVELLRTALMQTLNDPEYIADAKKVGMAAVNPTSGSDIEKAVVEYHSLPMSVKQKFKEVLSGQ